MVIAFIPVRGGSKSIPLKNIRDFCGKPLVYWTARAASMVSAIDRIIIATDSERIVQAVASFELPKVEIYNRDPENAEDTSSTESVMLEYLRKSEYKQEDTFILIQATSPMLCACDLEKGLELFHQADSVLSAVRCKRFFWSENGQSINYDYRHRPRRQEFDGLFMENGAFYINSVGNILNTGNRLSGKIAVAEMPDYSAFEIDEPDDWIIMETLMKRHGLTEGTIGKPIKLVLTDVDGILTDGGMYYSENGDELKKFNTRDGMGFQLLREAGIKTGIITSETTEIVARRAKKLKADFLIQGKRDGGKLAAAQEICDQLGFTLAEAAYIGDDVNCKDLLEHVGFPACSADAMPEVKKIPGIHVLASMGGNGVFREMVEFIMNGREG